MMLGRSTPRGVRGLGSTCVTYNLEDIQSYFGGGSQGVPFNLITVSQQTAGNGGCMPAYAVGLLPQAYIDGHTVGSSAPAVDNTYFGVTSGAPLIAPPAPPVAWGAPAAPTVVTTVGQNNAPVFNTQVAAPSSGVSTTNVPPVDFVPQTYPQPPVSQPSAGTVTPGTPAPTTTSTPAASSGLPATVGGIDTKVLLIGAVVALVLLGGK